MKNYELSVNSDLVKFIEKYVSIYKTYRYFHSVPENRFPLDFCKLVGFVTKACVIAATKYFFLGLMTICFLFLVHYTATTWEDFSHLGFADGFVNRFEGHPLFQLMAVVSIASLFAVLCLAIAVGVYILGTFIMTAFRGVFLKANVESSPSFLSVWIEGKRNKICSIVRVTD